VYDVQLSEAAQRAYDEADGPLQRKLDRCFEALAVDPRKHGSIKPLRGKLAGLWRFRVGDRRVIYRIAEAVQVVNVAAIAHRRDVCD
jgi:mRNA interferase RelE/StbE